MTAPALFLLRQPPDFGKAHENGLFRPGLAARFAAANVFGQVLKISRGFPSKKHRSTNSPEKESRKAYDEVYPQHSHGIRPDRQPHVFIRGRSRSG